MNQRPLAAIPLTCPVSVSSCGGDTPLYSNPLTGNGATAEELTDAAQIALDGIGALPIPIVAEIADGTNIIVDTIRGNHESAALGVAALTPFFGTGAGILKATKRLNKPLKNAWEETVEQATKKHGGNVTVQRDGIDLFRVHQPGSGHGFKVTQFKANRVPGTGEIKRNPKDVTVRRKHLKQLRRALKGDPRYSIRTKGGR